MFGEEEIVKFHRQRANAIVRAILLAFSLLLMRLWYLQIMKGDMFYEFSLNNKIRKESVDAPRGMIFSKDSKILVHNVPRFDAVVIPQYIRDKKALIKKLSTILNMSVEDIKKI